jgi:hypothetical protein
MCTTLSAFEKNMNGGPVEKISNEEYERQAVEYTTRMVNELNEKVRANPSIGAKSNFFQDQKVLPVFQGKHIRFCYDAEEKEIVDAVDVTNEPKAGPQVRTVVDLSSDEDEDDEDSYYSEEEEAREEDANDDFNIKNEYYPQDQFVEVEHVNKVLEVVEMELANISMKASIETSAYQ